MNTALTAFEVGIWGDSAKSLGFKVDATAKGKIEKFAGVDAYFATPSTTDLIN